MLINVKIIKKNSKKILIYVNFMLIYVKIIKKKAFTDGQPKTIVGTSQKSIN